jgi:hypothetical protein
VLVSITYYCFIKIGEHYRVNNEVTFHDFIKIDNVVYYKNRSDILTQYTNPFVDINLCHLKISTVKSGWTGGLYFLGISNGSELVSKEILEKKL